ncbi:DoxX family membrane protein [Anaeromyxobacter paludicola]|uniref:DoxX family protein n=1 Tax=Anaeromyxobacter paludicola TaxID=2918171 RepID=A0ABN6NF08_9BACT|nr:DoxX family protein [Anaeromyxobacter paludicola]BDG10633.1 hypothetical protein AMPC_37460 [Anaeromyxobacter paludicola]
MNDKRLESGYWALRIAFGVVPIVAGLDKFTNLLVDWTGYLSPIAKQLLPVSPATFMHLAGIIEVVVGIAVLTRFTRQAAWVACAWLVCIALNLLSSGHFLDIAVRDLVMAVGAFALARLAEVRDEAIARETATAAMRPARA